jgi:aldehyde:ferredoxin oxidoreductase
LLSSLLQIVKPQGKIMAAYMGKVLWVDLTSQTYTEEIIDDTVYRKYLSGVGLAAFLLFDRIPAGADPLGPENILGFMSGLLTGTPSVFSGRWMAVGKSPLTGTWGDASDLWRLDCIETATLLRTRHDEDCVPSVACRFC